MSWEVLLVDRSPALVSAWSEAFDGCAECEIVQGNLFDHPADAMVSPANSFGIMDGGLDLAIRERLGFAIQNHVQAMILERYHGEMPVGAAEVLATDNHEWPHLVVAPTMRVPESVAHTLNAYLSFRAALLTVARFNRQEAGTIGRLVVPGLGTGIGGLEPRRCAAQMRVAYRHASGPARIPSFNEIHRVHRAMRSAI